MSLFLPIDAASIEEEHMDFSRSDIINLNHIVVNKVTKEIRINARLAITSGILEYFLVGDHGKTYESVFKIDGNKPSELNFVLLLVGCEPLNYDIFMNLINSDDGRNILYQKHRQSIVQIDVFKNGKKINLSRLLTDREGKDEVPAWVYTGGFFKDNNQYAADLELSYISIWPDRTAPLCLFSGHQNPYRGQYGFEMREGLQIDEDYELVLKRLE